MFRSDRPSSEQYFIVYDFIPKNIFEWKIKMKIEKKNHCPLQRYRFLFCS